LNEVLPPRVYSRNPQYVQVEQAIAGIPGNQMAAAEKEAMLATAAKADQFITDFGGTRDISQLNEGIVNNINSTLDELRVQSDVLYDNLSFNPSQDLVFVSTLASSPIALAVGNNVPAKNIREFISYAKSRLSTPLAYASVGIASPMHLAGIHFSAMTGAPLVHAPYRGTGPALNDLLGGHIPVAMLGLPSLLPHARNGKLKILGVASATRSQLASEIPTIAESGVDGFEAGFWYHVVVPRGTPIDVIQRLRTAIDRVINSSEMKAYLAGIGFEPLTLSPTESAGALRLETEKWSRIIRENNIRGS
jgi:tripartite-type tricarboxylate transporter receptor subunit TctC